MLENKNHLLRNDPVVLALEAEIDALKYENEKLKYIIKGLNAPRGMRITNDIDEITLPNIPEYLQLPLTLESSLSKGGCCGWQMLVQANKSWGDFHYGFYTSEMELLSSGDIVSVAANLIERSMADLAHFYRRK